MDFVENNLTIDSFLQLVEKFETNNKYINIYKNLIYTYNKIVLQEEFLLKLINSEVCLNSIEPLQINLISHINSNNKLDFNDLDNTIKYGIRLFDIIISIVEENTNNIDNDRFIDLKIFNTKSNFFDSKINNFLNNRKKYWSYCLGKEKGNFKNFNNSDFCFNGKNDEITICIYNEFLNKRQVKCMGENKESYMRNNFLKNDIIKKYNDNINFNKEGEKIEMEDETKNIEIVQDDVEYMMLMSINLADKFSKKLNIDFETALDKSINVVLKYFK